MSFWELEGPPFVAAAIAAVSGTVLFLLLLIRSKNGKKSKPDALNGEVAELSSTFERLESDLRGLSQHLTCQLDSKMHALRGLMSQADDMIDQLRRLTDNQELTGRTPRELTRTSEGNRHARMTTTKSADQATHTAKGQVETSAASPDDGRRERSLEKRYAHVYWLADAGLDAAQITTKTGMHRGEVDLVLALRGRQEIETRQKQGSIPA